MAENLLAGRLFETALGLADPSCAKVATTLIIELELCLPLKLPAPLSHRMPSV